jgi:predicted HicB family RNase H-like nuclease
MAKKARTESIRVWVTPELKAAITKLADRDRRSLSTWIEIALERAVEAEKGKK